MPVGVAVSDSSAAKGEETPTSDIDLALIGDRRSGDITTVLTQLERQTGREINATMYTRKEWAERISSESHFEATLLREPKLLLMGDEEQLKRVSRDDSDEAPTHITE